MQSTIFDRRSASSTVEADSAQPATNRLRNYYLTRAAVSLAWFAGAVIAGRHNSHVAGLLIAYPAWDAVANYSDAHTNGGVRHNPVQTLNLVVSILTAGAVAFALQFSMHAVIGVFAVWAVFAGVLQLLTAVRRWKSFGAQWVMVLSGAQSALAGAFMASVAAGPREPTILDITGYAAFGAFYFLVSGIWLIVSQRRDAQRQERHRHEIDFVRRTVDAVR